MSGSTFKLRYTSGDTEVIFAISDRYFYDNYGDNYIQGVGIPANSGGVNPFKIQIYGYPTSTDSQGTSLLQMSTNNKTLYEKYLKKSGI